jgi:hypothetical protein
MKTFIAYLLTVVACSAAQYKTSDLTATNSSMSKTSIVEVSAGNPGSATGYSTRKATIEDLVTAGASSGLSLPSLTLTGSGGYMWSGLGTNTVVSNGTNYVFDYALGDNQWMVPTNNVNIMFSTNGSTNTIYGKAANATLTVDLRGKAFTCRLSFPTGWYRIGVLTTNNALLTTNTLNKIALEGTDAAANTIVTNTAIATGYGQ